MSDKTDSHKTEEKLCTTAPDKDRDVNSDYTNNSSKFAST